ncbi:PTS system fructose-specific transporter subunit IIABC [Lacticaseibacillus brantae DSM 23927]|uniref:PTS system fructose-specific transporter subunit IIABC n=1 Tax=Lacticaseibacillus brantae DSM 23927 TaxID=1423727 RepID=A0A0R2B6U4_9LACO|nr:fructose-specific PTS transporter subunit EIIC [Lacticaseibacillus brantae]KRM72009.1 PTS system fructose-specific transporter subunit IIABC [Lacticaseibacillus brantae DSM 23927]
MAKYDIIAATGCATGIAHTYMAQEALEQAAKKMGLTIKVETHGQTGVDDPLTPEEIAGAQAVVIASDIDVDADRFAGLPVVNVPVAAGIREPDHLIKEALDPATPKLRPSGSGATADSEAETSGAGLGNKIYTSLMNGVSHMLPFVVAGGVLVAISFLWGIYSADPKNEQYNAFAAMLNSIGGASMGLMVPVLSAYIAEAIAKRSGLVLGFVAGMIAYNGGNGSGFLGAILAGYLSGLVVLGMQKLFVWLPDREFRGLKAIFLYPVLGVFTVGTAMWLLNTPMKILNTGLMDFLKGLENTNPIILGIVVGAMCAADFGGPINKAAYLTGTALLAQGNFFFMAGVSAACIAPPLATAVAVFLNKKAYSRDERSAGYVNIILGSTHITEGAIPFAAKNPLWNIPAFMIGSAIAAVLTYVTRIQVPAPHGGFIILPLVNHPLLWVLWILIGAVVSGVLLAMIAGRSASKHGVQAGVVETMLATEGAADEQDIYDSTPAFPKNDESQLEEQEKTYDPGDILTVDNIVTGVQVANRDEALKYLADLAVKRHLAGDADAVFDKYVAREAEGSTGMEKGIAIPHAQDATIDKSSMLIVKLATPIEWQTFDGAPVDTMISFLIPEKDSGDHLKYLSNTAKLLTHEDFVKRLNAAQTPEELLNLFK